MPIMEALEVRARSTADPNGVIIARIDQSGIRFASAAVVGTIPHASPVASEFEESVEPSLSMMHFQMAINADIAQERIVHIIGGGQWRLANVYVAIPQGTAGSKVDLVIGQSGDSLLESPVDLSQSGLETPLPAKDKTLVEGDALAIKHEGTPVQGNMTIYLERVL